MKYAIYALLFILVNIHSGCTDVFTIQSSDYSLLDIVDDENVQKNHIPTQNKKNIVLNSEAEEHIGLDISHYQGNILTEIDPQDSLRFMICKATQGNYYIDPDFRINWREISEMGLIRGAYHFYVCDDDPITQAKHFVRNIDDIQPRDIAPILDIEQGSMNAKTDAKIMTKDILIFLNEVEKSIGRRPILYTDFAFAQEYLKDPEFSKYDLWLAEYTSTEHPKIPTVWEQKGFKIWQRTDHYTVDHRKADLDIFYGRIHQLVK
jgi:GH25 family lysozyme M1 (1,4-beta-N-acetylmuramidase)